MRCGTKSGRGRRGRGYTLVEMLIVVTVLGIAGMMVVPNIRSTDVLRVQGAIRMIVADLTVAQSDAIALQRSRAIVFHSDEDDPHYTIVDVPGTAVDESLNRLDTRRLGGDAFGFTSISAVNLPSDMVIFDPLGGPVDGAGSGIPAADGWIELTGSGQRFRIHIQGYTGRVTVERMTN